MALFAPSVYLGKSPPILPTYAGQDAEFRFRHSVELDPRPADCHDPESNSMPFPIAIREPESSTFGPFDNVARHLRNDDLPIGKTCRGRGKIARTESQRLIRSSAVLLVPSVWYVYAAWLYCVSNVHRERTR